MVMRKVALTEQIFLALEKRADGMKIADIPGGYSAIDKARSRIVEFGYEGIIPESIVPKYSPEELCMKFAAVERTPPAYMQNPDFSCGYKHDDGTVTIESDIRVLDLSLSTFRALNNRFVGTRLPYHPPILINHLVSLTEQDLLKIRLIDLGRLNEIKCELNKYGFRLGQSQFVDDPKRPLSKLEMQALEMYVTFNDAYNLYKYFGTDFGSIFLRKINVLKDLIIENGYENMIPNDFTPMLSAENLVRRIVTIQSNTPWVEGHRGYEFVFESDFVCGETKRLN